jgi:hypothetical protein
MDNKTRDYMETRVTKFNKLESEKKDLESKIEKIDKDERITYIELGGYNTRIPEGARPYVAEAMKDAFRKRIGEIERLMEEI